MAATTQTIKVWNVCRVVNETIIKDLFGFFGNVDEMTLASSSDIEGTQECILTFEEQRSVAPALHLTGTMLGDRVIIVTSFTKDEPEDSRTYLGLSARVKGMSLNSPALAIPTPVDPLELEEISRTVYVGSINVAASADELREFLDRFGKVLYVSLAGNANQPSRYAFVMFEAYQAAQKALANSGVEFMGFHLKINHAKSTINKPNKVVPVDQKAASVMDKIRHFQQSIAQKYGVNRPTETPPAPQPTQGLPPPPPHVAQPEPPRRSASRSLERHEQHPSRDVSRSRERSHRRRRDPHRDHYYRGDDDEEGYRRKSRRYRSPPRRSHRYSEREREHRSSHRWSPSPSRSRSRSRSDSLGRSHSRYSRSHRHSRDPRDHGSRRERSHRHHSSSRRHHHHHHHSPSQERQEREFPVSGHGSPSLATKDTSASWSSPSTQTATARTPAPQSTNATESSSVCPATNGSAPTVPDTLATDNVADTAIPPTGEPSDAVAPRESDASAAQ
ncbi:hypothetical protein H4R34_003760 [Dimargaris verticillata]|uniref:RRM domain-containing protein n=1 Tax=Dimargaris verticillata TaxID=2761393 RepID=A0A9W8B5L9_9FUNG|nr:hypothetical protein H4R34_003760 [Dimargaris verticillata]